MAFDPNAGDVGPTNQNTDNSAFLKQLAAALAAAGGGLAGRAIANNSGDPMTSHVPPQLSQLLDIGVQRQAYSNPLYQATVQGTHAMLPTFAKQGTALTGSLSNAIPAAPPADTGGGLGTGAKVAGSAGLAALAALLGKNGGNGGSLPLKAILDQIKKLFQHNGPTVQGNKPGTGGALTGPGAFDPNSFMGWDTTQSQPSPNVTTSESFSWPNDVLNDPSFLNSQWNGNPSDPSNGTGIGPGMQDFRQSGGGSDPTGTNWWSE